MLFACPLFSPTKVACTPRSLYSQPVTATRHCCTPRHLPSMPAPRCQAAVASARPEEALETLQPDIPADHCSPADRCTPVSRSPCSCCTPSRPPCGATWTQCRPARSATCCTALDCSTSTRVRACLVGCACLVRGSRFAAGLVPCTSRAEGPGFGWSSCKLYGHESACTCTGRFPASS